MTLKKTINGQFGLLTTPQTTLDVNDNNICIRDGYTPASMADGYGQTGFISWDGYNIYVKTQNGWRGAPLATIQTLSSTQDGYALSWDNTDGYWKAKSVSSGASGSAGGDLSGTYPNPTVAKIQGNAVNSTVLGASQDGYLMQWDNTDGYWRAASQSASTVFIPNIETHKVISFNGRSTTGTPPADSHTGFATFDTSNGVIDGYTLASTTRLTATSRTVMHLTTSNQMGVRDAGKFAAWRGNGAGLGGWKFRCRFAISTLAASTKTSALIGLYGALSGWATATDFTANNGTPTIGMAATWTTTAGSALPTANWQIIEASTTTTTLHDLGSNFALTLNDFLELVLLASPNDSKVTYVVTSLTTGNTTSGILNTSLPSNTTFLTPLCWNDVITYGSGTQGWTIANLYLEYFDG